MTRFAPPLVTAFVFALVLAFAPAARSQGLDDATFASWRQFILPGPDEAAWRAIPWLPRLWDAVLEADRVDRPILLWAMNGHPLGCT